MSGLILAIVVMIVVFWVLAGWALRKDRRRHAPAEDREPLKKEEVV